MSAIDASPFTQAEIAAEGLKPEEYDSIVERLGRHPNKAELGMFGVMWSEHCCYKNSRPLLGQFPTSGPRILVGPGENAGVVDIGDGLQLAFKIESHNHPSAVEPFQGAATGVGGILRDIFTMGARPLAILNSLRFGNLESPQTRRLFEGVVSGISHYGNCVGVPTVGGEVFFDEAYSGNPLVNAMALGLMETEEIVKAGASGIGNPVLYVGSTTGRDGMGGASFASAELSDESLDNRPAVQVGDPFLEKSLIEACLEAFKTGAVVAAQDMGAAGLTCSTAEMAAKGGVGVDLDLDLIPVRESGMVPYEYLLSESQERMLFVAQAGREQELIDIFHRWGLQAVVAGRIIEEPIVRIRWQGGIAAEVPATALSDNTPIYHRQLPERPPEYARRAWDWTPAQLPPAKRQGIGDRSWKACLLELLDSPTIASKRWVYRQYDHQVQNNTVIVPGGADAAVVRLRPQVGAKAMTAGNKGVAATTDCNARYCYLNPYEGARAAVAEAARNLSCVGAEPLAVTDNLNFGSPEKPVGYWQLHEACRGLADACREFATPVTGGNVSLYNETLDSSGNPQPIWPTPVVGMVGVVDNLDRTVGQGFRNAGDVIYLLGQRPETENASVSLGGSEYLARLHGTIAGQPPVVDGDLEKAVQAAVRQGIAEGWVTAAHDSSEGGLAIALAEACIAGEQGASIDLGLSYRKRDRLFGRLRTLLGQPSGLPREDLLLFGEGGARILCAVDPAKAEVFEACLKLRLGQSWRRIGTVGGEELRISAGGDRELIAVRLEEMRDRWANAIERRLAL